jgi:futalosine hydrolase
MYESDQVLSQMKNVRSREIAGKVFCYGRLQETEVLLVNTGIGKVNAAHVTTCIMENFQVSRIINLGIGGAYPRSGLKVGDVAIASKEISGDEGVIDVHGWGGLRRLGLPLIDVEGKKYFNEFPLMLPSRASYNGGKSRNYITKSGNFVTVAAATGTQKRARELEKRFNGVCENMEGAAIAQVSAMYKVPMIEIRGISNRVGVRDKRKWNVKRASEHCQEIVLNVIGHPFL